MSLKPKIVGDVSDLPTHAFGPASLMWWGTVGFMLIEGTGFTLAGGAYFYLMGQVPNWPPGGTRPPSLLFGTLTLVVLVLSALPNIWVNHVAKQQKLGPARFGVILMGLIGIAPLVLRAYELTTLNVRWDENAYGSIIWTLMLLHSLHIATDVVDTWVLGAAMFADKVDGRRFSDVCDNAMYWHFVWLTWVPIYVLVYWVPRWV